MNKDFKFNLIWTYLVPFKNLSFLKYMLSLILKLEYVLFLCFKYKGGSWGSSTWKGVHTFVPYSSTRSSFMLKKQTNKYKILTSGLITTCPLRVPGAGVLCLEFADMWVDTHFPLLLPSCPCDPTQGLSCGSFPPEWKLLGGAHVSIDFVLQKEVICL